MSQTGYSKVQIYSSSTATNTPSASNLTNDTNGSELAINITDGKLFYKDNGGTVQVIASKASNIGNFSNTINVPNTFGFKNRIINGQMSIDQRASGASFTPSTTTAYGTCDRWAIAVSQNSKLTAQQTPSATETNYAGRVVAGFQNYLAITSSSAYSISSSDNFNIQQWIEGFNAADLQWGTSSAQTITLSFWVYSSLTGTFGGALQNYSSNRSYPFSYSIPVASTWTQISIVITGDTTGTWGKTNSGGIGVIFGLGVGSTYSGSAGAWAGSNYSSATGATSVVGTNGATFYLTGVQFEKGTQATSFDYRPYSTELALCQRYYTRILYPTFAGCDVANLQAYATSGVFGKVVDLPVQMRAIPTCGYSSLAHFAPSSANSATQSVFTAISLTNSTPNQIGIGAASGSSGLVAGNASVLVTASTSAWFDASVEL